MSFDRDRLFREIASLSRKSRLALCAFFSERLISFYEEYASQSGGQMSVFRKSLDSIWTHLEDPDLETVNLAALHEEAKENIPDEDDLDKDSVYAQDAAIAVTSALAVWATDSPKRALECLEQCYNVVDSIVLNLIVPDGIIDEAAEASVLEDPRIQEEFALQRSILDSCLELDELHWSSFLRALRTQAVESKIRA